LFADFGVAADPRGCGFECMESAIDFEEKFEVVALDNPGKCLYLFFIHLLLFIFLTSFSSNELQPLLKTVLLPKFGEGNQLPCCHLELLLSSLALELYCVDRTG
jgi:hypothetical protein